MNEDHPPNKTTKKQIVTHLNENLFQQSYELYYSTIEQKQLLAKPPLRIRTKEEHFDFLLKNHRFAVTDDQNNLLGYVIASIEQAPLVYDPGGNALFISELFIKNDNLITELLIPMLKKTMEDVSKISPFVIIIINLLTFQEKEKIIFLQHGITPVTKWWHISLPIASEIPKYSSLCSTDRLPQIADLICQRYEAYEKIQQVFWRRSNNCQKIIKEYLAKLHKKPTTSSYIATSEGNPKGGIIGLEETNHPYYLINKFVAVDDFTVKHPSLWPTIGEDLLQSLSMNSTNKEIHHLVVTCAVHDLEKEKLIRRFSNQPLNCWLVATHKINE